MNAGFLRFMRDTETLLRKHDVLALVGNETFFKEEAVHHWCHLLKRQTQCDEGHFDQKSKWPEIQEALNEYPLIGQFRLVIIRDFDKLKKFDTIKNEMKAWITDPLADIKAIFVGSEDFEDLPEGWEHTTLLKVVCNDMGPESQEFAKYIDYCLEGTNKLLSEEARKILTETFAHNLAFMKHEIKKAAMYEQSNEINATTLKHTLSSYPLAQVFSLVGCVVRRDLRHALQLVHELTEQGTDAAFLVHLLAQRLKAIRGAIQAQSYGEKLKEYMIRKRIPLFQYNELLIGVKTLREWQVDRFFDVLCETEFRVRSFGDGRLELERAVVAMCH